MKNVHLPDPEILDEIKEQAKFKTRWNKEK